MSFLPHQEEPPVKAEWISWLSGLHPEFDALMLEVKWKEILESRNIFLSNSCPEHGPFKIHAYDWFGFHQYHVLHGCPECKKKS